MNSTYLITGIAILLVTVHYMVMRGNAAERARRWLGEHHYRVRSFRSAWFRTMSASSFYRNTDRAFDFIAEVDDRDLGGTGTVRLRVWTDWLGKINNDVEDDWITMPAGEATADKPLMVRLADAQLDILRRVSAGETTIYARGQENFDETVDHIEALANRGMLTRAPAVEDGRPGRSRYSSIGSLVVTPEGKAWLESQRPQRGKQYDLA